MIETYEGLSALSMRQLLYRVDNGQIEAVTVIGINHDTDRGVDRICVNFFSGSVACILGEKVDKYDKFFLNKEEARRYLLVGKVKGVISKIAMLKSELECEEELLKKLEKELFDEQ